MYIWAWPGLATQPLALISAGPPGRPLRAGAPIIDILGGVFGVVAALSALRERDQTGKGQKVSSSLSRAELGRHKCRCSSTIVASTSD
nr:CoA transferase [Bradyrhizobium sp. 179]